MNGTEARENQLLYLYGIVREAHRAPAVESATPGVVVQGKLAAIVEPVPAQDFSPDALETHLTSVEWVARVAQKHEALLEAAMQTGPVIPARLCTLFSSSEAIKRALQTDEEALVATLDRLDGMEEWGLKVHCDKTKLKGALAETDAVARSFVKAAAAAPPGQSYLISKRRDTHVAELAENRILDVQEIVIETLEDLGLEIRLKPLLPKTTKADVEEMVMNLGALVRSTSAESFHTALEVLAHSLEAEGFTLECSGPWPPYSFTQSNVIDDEELAS